MRARNRRVHNYPLPIAAGTCHTLLMRRAKKRPLYRHPMRLLASALVPPVLLTVYLIPASREYFPFLFIGLTFAVGAALIIKDPPAPAKSRDQG